MKSMTADEIIKDARVLLTLGHSYLGGISFSSTDNENESSEEKNQTDKTNENINQFKEAPKEFSENLHDLAKTMTVSVDKKGKQVWKKGKQVCKKEKQVDKKKKKVDEKHKQNDKKQKRVEKKQKQVNKKGKQVDRKKTKKSCNKLKNQYVKGGEINVDLKIEVDPEFKKQDLGENQTLKQNIVVELSIEVPRNDQVDTLNDSFEQEIEGLLDDVLCGKQGVDEIVQNKFNKKTQLVLENKVQKKIEEIKFKISDLEQDHDENLERKIIEKASKMYLLSKPELFVEDTFVSLNQECAPFYEQIEQIGNFYFPNMPVLQQSCKYKMHTDSERDLEKKRNEEILQLLDREINENVDIDEIKILDTSIKFICNSKDKKKKNEKIVKIDTQIVNDIIEKNLKKIENDKIVVDNIDKETSLHEGEVQDKVEEISIEEICKQFDMVIQFNKEVHQNKDGLTQQAEETVNIIFNEELMKRFNEDKQSNIDDIVEQLNKEDVQFKIIKNLETKKKVGDKQIEEMKVDSQDKVQIDADKQTQQSVTDFVVKKENDKQLHLQLEFYRHLEGNEGKLIQDKFVCNVDAFKNKLLKKSDTDEVDLEFLEENNKHIKPFGNDLQTEVDKNSENFNVNIEDDFLPKPKLTNENTITLINNESQVKDEFETKEFGSDEDEELEVDIEGYDDDFFPKLDKEICEEPNAIIEDNKNDLLESEINIENNLNLTQIDEETQFEIEVVSEEIDKEVQEVFEEKIEEHNSEIQYIFDTKNAKYNGVISDEFYVNTDDDDENETFFKTKLETDGLNVQEESEKIVENNYCENLYGPEMSVKEIDEDFEYREQDLSKIEGAFIKPQHDHEEVVQQGFDKESHKIVKEKQYFNEINEVIDKPQHDHEVVQQGFDKESHKIVKEKQYFNEINEVIEVIEDVVKVEDSETGSISGSNSTEGVYIVSDEESFSSEEGSFSLEEELFSIDEELTRTEKKPIILEKVSSLLDDELFSSDEEELKKLIKENVKEENAKFKEYEKEIVDEESQNKKDRELNQQLKHFKKEYYTKLNKEYDTEMKSQVNKNSNSKSVYQEQQQTFLDLRHEFKKIKKGYENCVHKKWFQDLYQDTDEQNIHKEFPEKNEEKSNFKIDESIYNEIVNLQNEFNDLKLEFSCNVPVEKDEEIPYVSQKKPFNLFEKLYMIHKQKLCSFVNSEQWPENSLYPSSLLDSLFENQSDDKPNVFTITLYSVEKGYSVKIILKKNELPVETFFSYTDDTILKYVENEELPPHLLEVLDKAEPRLFYNGCVIAEIRDQQNGVPGELYRILLRPSNLSILNDVNQIITENDKINWTYERRLKLESKLLLMYNPVMCMDTSPIAGLTLHLQHQMLSCRKIKLNPLKANLKTSKFESAEDDFSKDTFEHLSLESKFSDEPRDSYKILVDHKFKGSVNLRKRKKEMPFVSPKYFGFSNEDLENDKVFDTSAAKSLTVPVETSLDSDKISLSRKIPTIQNSETDQTMSNSSLNDESTNTVGDELNLLNVPTSNDIQISSETYFTQSSQSNETFPAYKHVHDNGIGLKNKTPAQIPVLIQRGLVEQQTTVMSLQSDNPSETQLDGVFNTDKVDQANLQVDVDPQPGTSSGVVYN